MKPTHVAAVTALLIASIARAQPTPDYDFDWATIGDHGNPAFDGPFPFGFTPTQGRGSVAYTYRISRLEVTTSQWLEFTNSINALPGSPSFFAEPSQWGAEIDPLYSGPGHQWRLREVPSAGMLPVAGISWRDAGRYCNWLHNGKQATLDSLITGAYDTTTWGDDGPLFTDDPAHLPGAQFWVPTLDEWMKAARYDPNRYGEGQGGYWVYAGMSDVPLISGPPGEGQTSGGTHNELDPLAEWDIPLGAYGDIMSAYGLWDVSGGASEWTEGILFANELQLRLMGGSYAGDPDYIFDDHASMIRGFAAGEGGYGMGLRIASVPEPFGAGATLLALSFFRRRR